MGGAVTDAAPGKGQNPRPRRDESVTVASRRNFVVGSERVRVRVRVVGVGPVGVGGHLTASRGGVYPRPNREIRTIDWAVGCSLVEGRAPMAHPPRQRH